MTQWLDLDPIDVPDSLGLVVGGHPLVAETLARRGILTPTAAAAFLNPDSYDPALPQELPGLAQAAVRLRQAISDEECIAVWGDFDADGQTSTAVLLHTLRALDAKVIYHIPTRQQGHGFHRQGVEELVSEGVQLILTCDTGVTAHETIDHANRLGADVIVTDHHVPGDCLPEAVAVVNPRLLPAGHPLDALAGVGTAYQLSAALDPDVAAQTLDLVAIGTVADVAALIGDNRYLVQRGIQLLQTNSRPGLLAICRAAGLRPEGLTEEQIGFVLGPRLNALGRLDDASKGVELLTTSDPALARALATELEGLNAKRQWLTRQVTEAALEQVKRDPGLVDNYRALVLSHPAWPGGVVGIVAGRMAERYSKPAVLITSPEGKLARGSGRSVPGIDLIASLTDCAHLLETYGGHPGAAGFAIQPERIPEFRAALSRAVAVRSEDLPEPTLQIDAYVELSDLTLELVAELDRLAPFGPGNRPLTLAIRDVHCTSEAAIGRTQEHRRITVQDNQETTATVFWWHGAGWPLPGGSFDLAVNIRASDYRGVPEIQIQWLEARALQPATVSIEPAATTRVHDYRQSTSPLGELQSLASQSSIQIWAEVQLPEGLEARPRQELQPSRRLVLWTLPPGPSELQAVLDQVQPDEVYLFAQDPGMDDNKSFTRRLAGIVKYALRARDGVVDLEAAAAATAQRMAVVQAGLEWLAAKGQATIIEKGESQWRVVSAGGLADPLRAAMTRAYLDALLEETGAYRNYLLNTPSSALSMSPQT